MEVHEIEAVIEKTVAATQATQKAMVKETVAETLLALGVDASDPVEMQKDFNHLREWREIVTIVRHRGILTVVGVVITGVLGMLWMGYKSII